MQNRFKELEDELLREFPESHPKSTLFPSGAAMLDVTVGNETYVLEYHLDVGLGISRVKQQCSDGKAMNIRLTISRKLGNF